MHLLIAHAGALSPECAATLARLELPNLFALLARLSPTACDDSDETTLSPPHERALARELGWRVEGEDGRLPWAARAAAAAGIDVGDAPWGLLTPAHWLLARDHVSLLAPEALALGDDESRALCDAVRGYVEGDGWRLAYGAPLAWYASHFVGDGVQCGHSLHGQRVGPPGRAGRRGPPDRADQPLSLQRPQRPVDARRVAVREVQRP